MIITWPSGGHNGGCLEFGKDGYLYISTGDGSGPNPPDSLTTGQDISDLLGAILRIDVDRPDGDRAYRVPDDNPFVDQAGARSEIWSYGLRNPWKFGVDRETGDVFAADNGRETWEMVHRIVRGGNCGWPRMEGRVLLRGEVEPGPTPIVPPVKDHPHSEANSVIGGPVYRGNKLPDLAGSFVYGDYITGTIWALRRDGEQYSHSTLVDTEQRIVAFTQSSGGALYVLDYDLTGQIYELLPSTVPDTSASFPRRLSETGLFASVTDLKPAAGVVPYWLKAERWLDGAHAQRWVAAPGERPIELTASADGAAVYPDGTVFAKLLLLDQAGGKPLRLEMQILHFEDGVWRPYSYLWNEAGDDAQLVEPTGANRPIRSADTSGTLAERTWHVNAVNECKLCHNSAAGFVLGFTPFQLDGRTASAANSGGQLGTLAAQGVIASLAPPANDDPSQLVDPHDASQTLDARARSYLHVNCAACHRPGGNAIISFYLRRDLPFERLNTSKGSGIGNFGLRDPKIIVPGDPYRSLLLYRMSKLGFARMPYIGSRVVDSFGVSLIDEWLRSLPGQADFVAPGSQALSLLTEASAPREARQTAIRKLLSSTAGALALAVKLHRGEVAEADLQFAASLAATASRDVRGLMEAFVPESQRRATLGANADVALVLKQTGDYERGKLIYFSDAARCRACHDPIDRAKSLGPTLKEINKKYPSPADLLSHVVRPSQKIDEAFWAYLVATADGRLLTGLVVEKDNRRLVLKTAEKQVVAIDRDQIEELRRGEKSLMPDGLLSDLTAQEAADLLAYIRSVGS